MLSGTKNKQQQQQHIQLGEGATEAIMKNGDE